MLFLTFLLLVALCYKKSQYAADKDEIMFKNNGLDFSPAARSVNCQFFHY
jgi:hypothetical protein